MIDNEIGQGVMYWAGRTIVVQVKWTIITVQNDRGSLRAWELMWVWLRKGKLRVDIVDERDRFVRAKMKGRLPQLQTRLVLLR